MPAGEPSMPTLFDFVEPASNCCSGWDFKFDQSGVTVCPRKANKVRIRKARARLQADGFGPGRREEQRTPCAGLQAPAAWSSFAPRLSRKDSCDSCGFPRPAMDDGRATANASAVSELNRRRLITLLCITQEADGGQDQREEARHELEEGESPHPAYPGTRTQPKGPRVWLGRLPNPEKQSPAFSPGDYVRRWRSRFALSGMHRSISRHSFERAGNRGGTDRSLPAHLTELTLAVIEH